MPFGMSPFNLLLPSWWFAAYVGVAALLPVLGLLATMAKLRGKQWRLPVHRALPPAKVPGEFRRHAQPWIGRLGFLGFPLQECTEAEGSGEISWRMASSADQAVAILQARLPQGAGAPLFKLTLMSFLNDGRVLVTADRADVPCTPSHWQLRHGRYPTIEAQVWAHRAHVEGGKGSAAAFLPAAQQLSSRLGCEEQAVLDAMVASGGYRSDGGTPPVLKAAFPRLPKLALRELFLFFTAPVSGRRRDIATVAKGRDTNEDDDMALTGAMGPTLEELVERDIRRFRDLTAIGADNKYRAKKLGILIATVVVVVAALGRDSIPLTIAKVLGILAFHEFGHWAAMKAFCFTGMGRFFVPFLGPVDLGRKPQAPAWQQLVVILAGPMPGLLLGLLCLVAGFFFSAMPAALLNIAALAVVMNSFYLLPFLPLDGGRVVDLLLFRDLPIFRPFFTAVSALATLIASFAVKSRALRYIAFGMFGGLAWDFKMIKVVRGGRKLGWAGGVDDETEALRRIFTGVRQEKNDAFLRSHDWFRQIDVLLGEVLRKKPKLITRFLGGGFYAVACLLPLALVIGIAALVFVSGIHGMSKQIEASMEFAESYPNKAPALTAAQMKPIEQLSEATEDLMAGDHESGLSMEKRETLDPKALALAGLIDKLNWTDAGSMNHGYLLDDRHLSAWLKILCGRMEAATREGRLVEAARRAEVILHAASSLEPPCNQDQREMVRDAEMRALTSIETLAASGKLDLATLTRIEGRINQLNKAPLPEVENLLLVEGWATRQMEDSFGLSDTDEGVAAPAPKSSPDRLWKEAYRQVRSALKGGLLKADTATPATVALARHWKKSRKVGELPAEMAGVPAVASGEAEYIASFCEGHRLATWRRLTALSALRLEAYRQKSGKLPATWEHVIPGGAKLSLVQEKGPCLKLVDQREGKQKALPEWLGGGTLQAASLNHRCPLHGAAVPELSRK